MGQTCLFCGGDATEADHLARCDGRQGRQAAAYEARTNVRASDPPTSQRAADAVVAHVSTVQARVLLLHAHAPNGLTDDELLRQYAARWPCAESSPRKRRCDLTRAGLLRDSDATRIAANGCERIVWIVVDMDRAARVLVRSGETVVPWPVAV